MAKFTHLDAITRRHALTLLDALLRTKQPGDAARAATIHAWLITQRMILWNVLPFDQFELLDMGHDLYRSTGTAPTVEDLNAYVYKLYKDDLNGVTALWHEYRTLSATFSTIGLPLACALLESILAALTKDAYSGLASSSRSKPVLRYPEQS
jgi:hypothetical protein